MTGERIYPVLPCADLDDALAFYRSIGFEVTFSQRRPNPYAVVALDDIQIHLAGIEGFDPSTSYGSAIITVLEPGDVHEDFRRGMKAALGRVPTKGIPRILPVRSKAGTATGFSVVDVGGNWLRFYRSTESEGDAHEEPRSGLGRVIDVAARQGDSRGDEEQAVKVLDSGLLRYPDAPAAERFEAVLYRAELLSRLGEASSDDLAAANAILDEHDLGNSAKQELARVRESVTTAP